MATVIVTLGAPNDDSGALSTTALARLSGAIAEFQNHPNAFMLPTGGFGKHFNRTALPHHHYARRFLIDHGIPAERILAGVSSSNTVEDAFFSVRELSSLQTSTDFDLVIVTSDYHGPRARWLFALAISQFLPKCHFKMRLVRETISDIERGQRVEHEHVALETMQHHGVCFEGRIFQSNASYRNA